MDIGFGVQVDFHSEGCVLVLGVEVRLDEKVVEVDFGKGKKVDISEDAAEPPLVLEHLSKVFERGWFSLLTWSSI